MSWLLSQYKFSRKLYGACVKSRLPEIMFRPQSKVTNAVAETPGIKLRLLKLLSLHLKVVNAVYDDIFNGPVMWLLAQFKLVNAVLLVTSNVPVIWLLAQFKLVNKVLVVTARLEIWLLEQSKVVNAVLVPRIRTLSWLLLHLKVVNAVQLVTSSEVKESPPQSMVVITLSFEIFKNCNKVLLVTSRAARLLLETFKFVNAVLLVTSRAVRLLLETFKFVNAIKPLIPVKSVILFPSSILKSVIVSILEFLK